MLNKGQIQVGVSSQPNQISYGDQSPAVDAVPLPWIAGDFRYYIGINSTLLGWRCTISGTPGTWVPQQVGSLDLWLSYGDQSGDGALPTPPEATPAFFLRPNTNKTVQMAFSGSPGAVWEYEVGVIVNNLFSRIFYTDIFVYSCALTPAGIGPATLVLNQTINGSPGAPSVDLNGLTNTRTTTSDGAANFVPGDRVGLKVTTTNMGSGFLMMTAHMRIL